ncbi:MAG: hypothetical protein K1X67_12695 [Fimbriimonadaceae bacterium]|nr:hypothetical protein [Fimbriimonadaceae bacterium]
MRKWIVASFGVAAGLGGLLVAVSPEARAQSAKALVWLQPSTPGTTQVGHANVSGTVKSGAVQTNTFRLGTSSTNGYYLRTDALGNGTWGALSIPLPYDGTGLDNGYEGLFKIRNDGTSAAIFAKNNGSGATARLAQSSTGVYGEHGTSFNSGQLGNSDNGVSGHNNFNPSYGYLAGNSVGVWGEHGSTMGVGVRGRAYATSGAAYGVLGTSASASGAGVRATNSAGFGTALEGSAMTSGGYGLYAEGAAYGVYGYGNETGTQVYGGYLYGNGASARGVYAFAGGTGTFNYGVRGQASGATTTSYGVYSVGDMGTSGAKAFVIDHPLDPANKYLRHFCAEGPEPTNQYSGIVTTDAKGYAWVILPHYYSTINKSPRYQLTVVDDGEDFVLAKVTQKIDGQRFRIRTSKPNVEVSWLVISERNDLYMQQHPHPVEVEKDPSERGRYQHPELYGLPAEMGMDYQGRLRAETGAKVGSAK